MQPLRCNASPRTVLWPDSENAGHRASRIDQANQDTSGLTRRLGYCSRRLFSYTEIMSQPIVGKRKTGRPFVGSTSVGVRLPPKDLELLDLWIAENDPTIGRPEAIRRILRQARTVQNK
jgi:hypothetical protein